MKTIFFFKKIVMQHYIAFEHQALRQDLIEHQEFLKNIDQAIHLSLASKEVQNLEFLIEKKEKRKKSLIQKI